MAKYSLAKLRQNKKDSLQRVRDLGPLGLAEYAYAKPHREIGAEHVKAILEEALDLWPWGNSVAPIRGTSPTVREGSKYAT